MRFPISSTRCALSASTAPNQTQTFLGLMRSNPAFFIRYAKLQRSGGSFPPMDSNVASSSDAAYSKSSIQNPFFPRKAERSASFP